MPKAEKDISIAGVDKDNASTLQRDLLWVYHNVGQKIKGPRGEVSWSTNPTPEDAPSNGAWNYLCQLRSNPTSHHEFVKNIAAKAFAKIIDENRKAPTDDGREIAVVDRLIAIKRNIAEQFACPRCGYHADLPTGH